MNNTNALIYSKKLKANKALGQNFILDENLTHRIAKSAGDLTDFDILEIGPGLGSLTRSIIKMGARRVVCVEIDRRFKKPLEELKAQYPEQLIILYEDILSFDVKPFLRPPVKVISNLPYNIATQTLINFLNTKPWPPYWNSLTLMFQNEVANRIVATPGSKKYGRLSIISQYRSNAELILNVPASAFYPVPKVDSAVVRLSALKEPKFKSDRQKLERLVRIAFNSRRKMLRQSLKNIDNNIVKMLEELDIDPKSRPEEVSIEKFCALANIIGP